MSIINNERRIYLDLFLLHKNKDKHPKSWILASGNNLQKEVDSLLEELCRVYKKHQIVNKIALKLGVGIRLLNNTNPLKFGTEIKIKRKASRKPYSKLAEETHTSGKDWIRIETNRHFLSCKKLCKIYNILGNSKFLKVNCLRNDLCLEKMILVWNLMEVRNKVPIIVLGELLNLWKNTFSVSEDEFNKRKIGLLKSIDYLILNQHFSRKTKATVELTGTLAKIIGAFCADGNFYPPDMIRWEEGYISNMRALSKWIEKCFLAVKVEKSKRERNSWTIKFRNKIIARYLEVFFNFKPRIKVYTTRAPKVIRNASFNIQKSFAIGAMTFEAGMNSDGTVSLWVASKKFRDDIASIIQKEGIKIYVSNKLSVQNLWYLNSGRSLEKDQKIKLLSYFEKGTIKWLKFKEHLFGFNVRVKTFDEAEILLEKCYSNKRKEFLIEQLLHITRELKEFDIYDLIKKANVPRTSIIMYLNMFNKFNILFKRKRSRRIVYIYNNDINEWRLPIGLSEF